jgi:F-type H+-transporting ATPase subunit alpha
MLLLRLSWLGGNVYGKSSNRRKILLYLWEQTAIVYAGLNGYIDDVPADKANAFANGLRDYIKTNKPKYVEIIGSEKKITDEAEGMLKEAITEFKQGFAA